MTVPLCGLEKICLFWSWGCSSACENGSVAVSKGEGQTGVAVNPLRFNHWNVDHSFLSCASGDVALIISE